MPIYWKHNNHNHNYNNQLSMISWTPCIVKGFLSNFYIISQALAQNSIYLAFCVCVMEQHFVFIVFQIGGFALCTCVSEQSGCSIRKRFNVSSLCVVRVKAGKRFGCCAGSAPIFHLSACMFMLRSGRRRQS